MIAVDVDDVSKKFGGVTALRRIRFKLESGKTLVLVGPNGAGKSTLQRIIAGLYKPDAGSVALFGKKINYSDAKDRSRVSFVGENYSLYDNLSVRENLLFFSTFYNMERKDALEKISELLEKFNAKEFEWRKVGGLSRGTKQKVAVCRALMNDPKLLLLDEPTAFLDANAAETLRVTLGEMSGSGTAIIYATQRLDEINRLGNKIALLNHGRLASFGTVAEVLKKINGTAVEISVLHEISRLQSEKISKKLDAEFRERTIIVKVDDAEKISDAVAAVLGSGCKITAVSYLNSTIGKVFGEKE